MEYPKNYEVEGQMSIFDLDIWSGKTCAEPFHQTREKTLGASSKKQRGSLTKMPMYLDLRKDRNGHLADSSWEMDGLSLGEYMMPNIGEFHKDVNAYVYLLTLGGASAGEILFELERETPRGESEQTVGHLGEESQPEVQTVTEGLPGDFDESGSQGERVTHDPQRSANPASFTLKIRGGVERDSAGKKAGKGPLIQTEMSATLGVSQDKTLITVGPKVYGISAYESNAMKSSNPHSGIYEAETARTLDLNGGSPACNQGGMMVVQGAEDILDSAVCVENHPNDSRVKIREDNICQTLSSRMGTGGNNVPMVMEPVCVGNGQLAQARISDKVGTLNCMHDQQAVITYGLDRASFNQGKNAKFNFSVDEELVGAQTAKGPGAVYNSVVRRLTPLECTRLQAYPDGWVNIGEWVDSKGKTHKDADSPKYKALGNSIALPFWEWMAKRMRPYLGNNPTMASLFDGIGGFPLVFTRAGFTPVWASEIEEFPMAVTKLRFPSEEE